MKKFIVLFLLISIYQHSQAQHRIEFKIKGLRDTTLYLAHHFGEPLFLIDSARLDASGLAVFEGKNALPAGAYKLYVGKRQGLNLVINDQNFSMETDTVNFYGNLIFKGSNDARIYHDYSLLTGEVQHQMENDNFSDTVKAKMVQALSLRIKDFLKVNEGTFSAKLIKAGIEVEMPFLPNNPTKQDSTNLEKYGMIHYWDNLDLTDERMMYTPTITEKLYAFIPFITQFKLDSIIKIADGIIDKTPVKSELRKYIVSGFIKSFRPNKAMGNDAIYVHLADKYMLNTPETPWDTASINYTKKDLTIKRPLLIGKKIPKMEMTDTTGRYTPLHGVEAKYTLLVIYDPECGDCKATIDNLVSTSQKLAERNIKVYLACALRNKKIWLEFIKTHKTEGFINVFDGFKATNFTQTFNTINFPNIFLLDKDKKIMTNKRLELKEYLALVDEK